MNGIILPEVIIYNALESVIAYIRKDLSEHNGKDEEKKTILYRLMGENIDGKPLKFNHWDFFKQTKKIFSDKGNLSVNFGFNFEVAKFLSLHIILPSEEAAESAIGQDEGYSTEIEDDGKIIYSGRAYSVNGMASIDIQDIVADYLECNKLFEPTNRNYGKIFNIYIGNDATPIKYGYYNSWSYGDEVLYIEDAYVLHRPIKTSIPCGVRLPISVFCPNRIPAIRNDVKIMGIEK